MTRSNGLTALLLAGVASLALSGCHSHTTIVEPTRTVDQPVIVDHHDDHHPPPPHDDHHDDHR